MAKPKLDPLAARRAHMARMKEAPLGNSMLGYYLAEMMTKNPDGANAIMADIAETFSTDEGLRVLILFENSVLKCALPNGSSDSALREANALRNFVLEIMRIVSNA